jgi:hypothetical protein
LGADRADRDLRSLDKHRRVRIVHVRPGVLVAVHPDGGEYLTTPHPGDDTLVRHRFADDRPIEELAAADVLGTEEGWDWSAGYLTDSLILAGTFESGQDSGRHVLIQRAPMRLLGEVVYPGDAPPGWILGPSKDIG